MSSSEKLSQLQEMFIECIETVLNSDSAISDDKFEVIKDVHNKADMFTDQLQLLRRAMAQQEILCASKEDLLKTNIEVLKSKIRRKKQLISKSKVKFEEWKIRISSVQDTAVKSYVTGTQGQIREDRN